MPGFFRLMTAAKRASILKFYENAALGMYDGGPTDSRIRSKSGRSRETHGRVVPAGLRFRGPKP